jgi:hypothetical protein
MRVTGNARYDCIIHSACGSDAVNIMWQHSIKYNWAIGLCCLRCSKNWVVCHSYKSVRSPLSSYSISRHNRLKHLSFETTSQPAPLDSDDVEGITIELLPVNDFDNGDDEDIESDGYFNSTNDTNGPDKEYISFGDPSSDFFFLEGKGKRVWRCDIISWRG